MSDTKATTPSRHRIMIDPLSATSLHVEARFQGTHLGTATGFTVEHGDHCYLITNWHVVTGRDPQTGKVIASTGAVPDELLVTYHASTKLGDWVQRGESLHTPDGKIRWLEHPQGSKVDVVALPLESHEKIKIHPLDLALAESDVAIHVALPVCIIGYPYGLGTAGRWPIWKTGHVASDPDLDYDGRPVFLIDATTRGGMSGSPVVARFYGGYVTTDGGFAIGGKGTRFLGVYAGRIHDQAEIGYVWRPRTLLDILKG